MKVKSCDHTVVALRAAPLIAYIATNMPMNLRFHGSTSTLSQHVLYPCRKQIMSSLVHLAIIKPKWRTPYLLIKPLHPAVSICISETPKSKHSIWRQSSVRNLCAMQLSLLVNIDITSQQSVAYPRHRQRSKLGRKAGVVWSSASSPPTPPALPSTDFSRHCDTTYKP